MRQKLYQQVRQLPIRERLALMDIIMQSVQPDLNPPVQPKSLAKTLVGLAKTDLSPLYR